MADVFLHICPHLQVPLTMREASVPMICRSGSELREIVELEFGDRLRLVPAFS